jgi:hypothetical protein
MQGQQKKVPSARLNLLVLHSNPLERAELQELQESGLQGLPDLLVLLARLEGRLEPRGLLAKGRLGLQDYLVLTELQVRQVFAELQEAQAFKVNKAQLDNKVLQESAQVELRGLPDSKAQSGQKVLLEWLALAELQD